MQNIQDNLAEHLSEGQKRKLTFGIAILGDPQVSVMVHVNGCRLSISKKSSSSFTTKSSRAFWKVCRENVLCLTVNINPLDINGWMVLMIFLVFIVIHSIIWRQLIWETDIFYISSSSVGFTTGWTNYWTGSLFKASSMEPPQRAEGRPCDPVEYQFHGWGWHPGW